MLKIFLRNYRISLDTGFLQVIIAPVSMRDGNEKSPMGPADAVSSHAHYTPGMAAVGPSGLETEGSTVQSPDGSVGKIYPTSSPAAEAQDGHPVAGGVEDFTIICSWCGFMSHLGRGPVSHNICKICRIEFFPEVPIEQD